MRASNLFLGIQVCIYISSSQPSLFKRTNNELIAIRFICYMFCITNNKPRCSQKRSSHIGKAAEETLLRLGCLSMEITKLGLNLKQKRMK